MIYLVSTNDDRNFGAVLQAYAFQKFLEELGYNSEYITINRNINYLLDLQFSLNPRILFRNIVIILTRKKYLDCFRKFDDFVKTYQKTTKQKYTYTDLCVNPPVAEAYIVGSDQMWPPTNMKPENFLCFGDQFVRRISYAVSLGKSFIPKNCEDKFKKYLKKIDCISIREKSSRELIEKYVDKKVYVNIDPTLLIDSSYWISLQVKPKEFKCDKYVLVYLIYKPKDIDKQLRKLHKETGLDIVLVTTNPFRKAYSNIHLKYSGPLEFLWLINHASYVVSSSYHGCLFSIIFQKNFLALVNPESSDRHRDMLEKFDLSSREVSSLNIDSFVNIDYNKVYEIIDIEREKSKQYILDALRNDEKTD